MSSNRERRISFLTAAQKYGSRVSDRWVPMKQAIGKDRHGQMQYLESYVDMRSGGDGGEKQTYTPEEGWNGAPKNLPSGDPGREAARQPPSERYRENFPKIDWSR